MPSISSSRGGFRPLPGLEVAVQAGQQQLLLAAKVPVEGAGGDVHLGGDVGHAHLVIAKREEPGGRRGQDVLFAIGRPLPRHSTPRIATCRTIVFVSVLSCGFGPGSEW
jgi:hypothetical protein